MPYVKEPHYFGSDLTTRRGFPTLKSYLTLFREGQGKLCMEGSTWYLYSHCAAQELSTFDPDAKIIIMVRNPSDLVRSWHAHALLAGVQDQTRLEDALALEDARRSGKALPRGSPREKLIYTDIPRFTEQIRRYQQVFSPEQLHIITYDDFSADNAAVVADTFGFLGVDPSFVPKFDKINASGETKSPLFRTLLEHQPESVRKFIRSVTPRRFRTGLKDRLRQFNTVYPPKKPVEGDAQQFLKATFRDEVESVSKLLGRDLTSWNE